MSSDYLIKLENVTKEFSGKKGRVKALEDINLEIKRGEFVVIVGPSGAGKTTLLNIMAGMDRPTKGRVIFSGRDYGDLDEEELAKLRREKFGFIFQFFNLIDSLTVVENVIAPALPSDLPIREISARAEELLAGMKLLSKKYRFPKELSAGEQQRVAIARAMITKPEVLFCDEPTAQLDEEMTEKVLNDLTEINRAGTTVILATASETVANKLRRSGARTIHIEYGKITSTETPRRS
ncbi:MAG: ABC transporter ATP-binding protein [Crenarchaeota archaeon]|nr:ABC transporter ATP-binding protein [Thermoproteota archaeon]